MNLSLNDQHILVAGGLGGIGTKTVELLLNEGALVTILTQSQKQAEKSKLIHENLTIQTTDYSNKVTLYKDIKNTQQRCCLSGFISLIGTGKSQKKAFLSAHESSRIWNINYFFPRQIAEQFVKVTMKFCTHSCISNHFITFCSSIAASCYLGAPTEYSVAKHALERLTKELSWKLAPNYRVNCISPGNIYFEGGTWDRIKKSNQINIEKLLEKKVPLQRLGTPIDIAGFTVFLSSSKYASFFNGSCITIDGGQKNCI